MRKLATLTALSGAMLMLAACGSADDASTEASADTVEMPADAALAPIGAEPVADPNATATDTPAPEATATAPVAEEAGDAAATVAAEAAAAAEEPAE